MDDNQLLFDRNVISLGHVRSFGPIGGWRTTGASAFNGHRVGPDARPRRIEPGLASLDIKLPPMPWAAQDLAVTDVLVFPRLSRHHAPPEAPLAQRASLMRAPVAQRVERAPDVEHPDRAPGDLN